MTYKKKIVSALCIIFNHYIVTYGMHSLAQKHNQKHALSTHKTVSLNLKQLPPEMQNMIAEFLPMSGVLLELFAKNHNLSARNTKQIINAFVRYVDRPPANKPIEIPSFFKLMAQSHSNITLYNTLASTLSRYNTTIEIYSAGYFNQYELKPIIRESSDNHNLMRLAASGILMIKGNSSNIAKISKSVIEEFPGHFQYKLLCLKKRHQIYTLYNKFLGHIDPFIVPCCTTSILILLGYLAYGK